MNQDKKKRNGKIIILFKNVFDFYDYARLLHE